MTNKEIRRKIIEMVYERFKEHPYYRVTPKEFKEALNISLRDLHYNIIYLEEKGLLELQKPLEGDIFVGARITPQGIDLIEDEYEFNIMFPESETEETHGNADFNRIIKDVQSSSEMSVQTREIIVGEIKEIRDELKKNKPSFSRIKKIINKLKNRNDEIYGKVIAIIKQPTITKQLRQSARKELEKM